tara:strand:+ start:228 stop:1181 length:954 start_codon:yes stop_codon:yes gene_type:complete
MSSRGYRDYFKILGVERSANKVELKRAFRSKARKYHPDLNPNDPNSEAKFKEISEAYEVLSDPEKRKRYEQYGQYWNQVGGESINSPFGQGFDVDLGGYGNFDEFINELLGRFSGGSGVASEGGYSRNTSPAERTRGSIKLDAKIKLNITFGESFLGGERTLLINNERVKIKIPRQIKSGSKLRVKGKGNIQPGTGKRGDLYLEVNVQSHPVWKIEGEHIYADLPLSIDELILGTKILVLTPDGEATINIPQGMRPDQNIRLKGKGLPSKNGYGDLIFTLKIHLPAEWSSSERELIKKLSELRDEDPRKDWFNSARI